MEAMGQTPMLPPPRHAYDPGIMDWVWYIILLPVLGAGFFLTLLNLPGNWVMILATGGYALVTRSHGLVGWPALVILAGLGIAGEIVESVAGSAGAKRAGGSGR